MATKKTPRKTAKKTGKKSAKRAVKTVQMIPEEKPIVNPPEMPTWKIIAVFGVIAVVFGLVYLVVTNGLSIGGLTIISPASHSYTYNGFVFNATKCTSKGGTCWRTQVVTNIAVNPITFYYGPKETQDVLVSQAAVDRILNLTYYNDSGIIVTFDNGVPGEVAIAGAEISRITGRVYRIPTAGAVYGNVTCADGTPRRAIIYLTQGPTAEVRDLNGCVVLTANTTQDLVRVADAFSLHLLRIVNNQ